MTDTYFWKYGFTQIPALTTAGVIFSLIIAFGLPIALLIIWRVKTKANVSMFFLGAATFVSFALLLEKVIQAAVLQIAGDAITENVFAYALVGGLFAGVFEECGRYITMLVFMSAKKKTKENSIMLGIGHGGIEAIILLGITSINNLIYILMLNSGTLQSTLKLSESVLTPEMLEESIAALAPLWTTSSVLFFVGGLERIFAIAFHICMSYLVYRAYRDRKPVKLLLAVLIHAAYDGIMYIVSVKLGAVPCEIFIGVYAIVVTVLTIIEYKKDIELTNDEDETADEPMEMAEITEAVNKDDSEETTENN